MPFEKPVSGLNTKSLFKTTDLTNCCGTGTLSSCTASVNLSSVTVAKITINGTDYTFGTAATTAALWIAGVRAAFDSAGYEEIGVSVTTSVSGSNTIIKIITTATVNKFISSAPADITVTCTAV